MMLRIILCAATITNIEAKFTIARFHYFTNDCSDSPQPNPFMVYSGECTAIAKGGSQLYGCEANGFWHYLAFAGANCTDEVVATYNTAPNACSPQPDGSAYKYSCYEESSFGKVNNNLASALHAPPAASKPAVIEA